MKTNIKKDYSMALAMAFFSALMFVTALANEAAGHLEYIVAGAYYVSAFFAIIAGGIFASANGAKLFIPPAIFSGIMFLAGMLTEFVDGNGSGGGFILLAEIFAVGSFVILAGELFGEKAFYAILLFIAAAVLFAVGVDAGLGLALAACPGMVHMAEFHASQKAQKQEREGIAGGFYKTAEFAAADAKYYLEGVNFSEYTRTAEAVEKAKAKITEAMNALRQMVFYDEDQPELGAWDSCHFINASRKIDSAMKALEAFDYAAKQKAAEQTAERLAKNAKEGAGQ